MSADEARRTEIRDIAESPSQYSTKTLQKAVDDAERFGMLITATVLRGIIQKRTGK